MSEVTNELEFADTNSAGSKRSQDRPVYKICLCTNEKGEFFRRMPDRYIKFNSVCELIEAIQKLIKILKKANFRFQINFLEPTDGYQKLNPEEIEEICSSIDTK